MMYFTLLGIEDGIEKYLFENPDTGLSKNGTFDRKNKVAVLDQGNLGWPAEDGRLRSIMLNAANVEIGERRLKAFG